MKTAIPILIGALLLAESLFAGSTIQFPARNFTVNEAAGQAELPVVRVNDLETEVAVEFFTIELTATASVDYTAVSGTVTFEVGETNHTIIVPIHNDRLIEGMESFQIALTNATGDASLGANRIQTITIRDNETPVRMEYIGYWTQEDEGSVQIGIVREGDTDPLTLEVVTVDGTAKAGEDYEAMQVEIALEAGENLKLVNVPIINDGMQETAETFRVYLTNAPAGTLGTLVTAMITIADNDPGVEFEFIKSYVQENEGTLSLTIRRGNDVNLGQFAVEFVTVDQTAIGGQDYGPLSSTLYFSDGEMQKTVAIPIMEDALLEPVETFQVILRNPSEVQLGSRSTCRVSLLDTSDTSLQRIHSIDLQQGSEVKLELRGAAGSRFKQYYSIYPLEISPNLQEWFPLTLLRRANWVNRSLYFAEQMGIDGPARFYRTPARNLVCYCEPPAGPYSVGIASRLLSDSSRRNRYRISANGSFMISIWHPAMPTSGARLSPLTDWMRPYLCQDQAPVDETELAEGLQWMSMVACSYADAPILRSVGPCPVIVYSPGYTAPRSQNGHLWEHLASHGYVVVSIDHGDAFPTVFPDGKFIDVRSVEIRLDSFEDRVRDIRFVLDELARWNADDPDFQAYFDLSQVGVAGFSWGAWSAAEVCRLDSRPRAAFVLDGGGTASEGLFQAGCRVPVLTINQDGNWDARLFNLAITDAIFFAIANTDHSTVSGYYDSEVRRTCRDWLLAFLNKYVREGAEIDLDPASYSRISPGFQRK